MTNFEPRYTVERRDIPPSPLTDGCGEEDNHCANADVGENDGIPLRRREENGGRREMIRVWRIIWLTRYVKHLMGKLSFVMYKGRYSGDLLKYAGNARTCCRMSIISVQMGVSPK